MQGVPMSLAPAPANGFQNPPERGGPHAKEPTATVSASARTTARLLTSREKLINTIKRLMKQRESAVHTMVQQLETLISRLEMSLTDTKNFAVRLAAEKAKQESFAEEKSKELVAALALQALPVTEDDRRAWEVRIAELTDAKISADGLRLTQKKVGKLVFSFKKASQVAKSLKEELGSVGKEDYYSVQYNNACQKFDDLIRFVLDLDLDIDLSAYQQDE